MRLILRLVPGLALGLAPCVAVCFALDVTPCGATRATATPSDASEPARWSDGIGEYEDIAPIEGFLVPVVAFRGPGMATTPAAIRKAGRPMTRAELAAFSDGERWSITDGLEFPVLVFPNRGLHIALWQGWRQGPQQIVPRYWNGRIWTPFGEGSGRRDSVATIFRRDPEEEFTYLLVTEQGSRRGERAIHTQRLRLARFPGALEVLRAAIRTSATVVHLPRPRSDARGERLDCLAGEIGRSALKEIVGGIPWGSETLYFLDGKGAMRFSYRSDPPTLIGPHGRMAVPRSDLPRSRAMRWFLAREAAGNPPLPCFLREVPTTPGGWRTFELVMGKEAPGFLIDPPLTRSGTDRGEPLFAFVVETSEGVARLAPRGRFGRDSFSLRVPERDERIGIVYQFIPCGDGVVKLALRPLTTPWEGRVHAECDLRHPFSRLEPTVPARTPDLDVRVP